MPPLPCGLRWSENADGSRDVRADDIATIKTVIGDDGLAAFLRVFAAANRLSALASMTRLCKDMEHDSLRTRNRFTVFFLSLGVAHEVVAGLEHLEKVLREKGCADILGLAELEPLREFRTRWGEQLSRRLRNKLAFHFDPDCYAAGVRRLGSGGAACVAHLDRDLTDAYFPLADEALLLGTEDCLNGMLSEESISELAKTLWDDQKVFSARLFDLFARTMSKLTP
jgi:hypothetical protein